MEILHVGFFDVETDTCFSCRLLDKTENPWFPGTPGVFVDKSDDTALCCLYIGLCTHGF